MSEVTAKAKSAINSLNKAVGTLEKAQLYLLQAKTVLAKGDVIGRGKVEKCVEALGSYQMTVDNAIKVITENNPSQADGD